MWAFLASPLVRKIGMWLAIALGALWLLRIYSNKAWNDGYTKGKASGITDTLKAHEEQWKQEQAAIDSEKEANEKARAAVQTDKTVELQNRKVIVSTLEKGNADLSQKIDALAPAIAALPDNKVDEWIRKALQELRK